jgi:hypothetical protein
MTSCTKKKNTTIQIQLHLHPIQTEEKKSDNSPCNSALNEIVKKVTIPNLPVVEIRFFVDGKRLTSKKKKIQETAKI